MKEVAIDFQIKCDIFEADNMAYHHDNSFSGIQWIVLETIDCSPRGVFSLAAADA